MSGFAFIKNPDSIQTFVDRIIVNVQDIACSNEIVAAPFQDR